MATYMYLEATLPLGFHFARLSGDMEIFPSLVAMNSFLPLAGFSAFVQLELISLD